MVETANSSLELDTAALGLGVLSWRGYDQLRQSLDTYAREGLFDLFGDRVLFLPEIGGEGEAIAAEYGLRAVGTDVNLGILGGFRGMARALRTEYVLLLENDCPLIEPRSQVEAQLAAGLEDLRAGRSVVHRLRHRWRPGAKFNARDKYLRYHPCEDADEAAQTSASRLRRLRPGKARRLAGWSVHVERSPQSKFPNCISVSPTGNFLISTACLPWSNQPFLIRRRFFLHTLLARAARVNTAPHRRVNGFRTIEVELNNAWWRARGWRQSQGLGLFTHARG